MKMKRVLVTWEKSVSAIVYVPETMDDDEVLDIARETTESIDRDGWDVEWDTRITQSKDIDVPDEECRVEMGPSIRYPRVVTGSRFRQTDAMVVDDERASLVQPEDATWWLAPERGGEVA